jgi:hypothetical protein
MKWTCLCGGTNLVRRDAVEDAHTWWTECRMCGGYSLFTQVTSYPLLIGYAHSQLVSGWNDSVERVGMRCQDPMYIEGYTRASNPVADTYDYLQQTFSTLINNLPSNAHTLKPRNKL